MSKKHKNFKKNNKNVNDDFIPKKNQIRNIDDFLDRNNMDDTEYMQFCCEDFKNTVEV